jgi:hydrogenase-4 component E
MHNWIELAMIALVLANVALLGMSLLSACIRVVAFQGILLGGFAIAAQCRALTPRLFVIAAVSVILKGFVYPWLLRRAVREADLQKEIEPFVGYIPSVLAGIAMLGASLWIGGRLPLLKGQELPLVVPAALMTMLTGLFLVVARKKALTQCLGYLAFENGIYTFGIAAVGEIPALVELGILLDAFVAVLVMGVAMYHINREFDHLDADRLSTLKG